MPGGEKLEAGWKLFMGCTGCEGAAGLELIPGIGFIPPIPGAELAFIPPIPGARFEGANGFAFTAGCTSKQEK